MGSRLESNSSNVRKSIENHNFDGENGEEYEASTFGGFTDYMRRKKIKLQNLDAEIRKNSQGNPPIFRGVVACVNGYTQPSLNDLHALVVGYGGGFIQYLDGKTTATHIIASNLTPKKKEEFKRYRVVSPQWVVDSVRAGKLQPWDQYRVVDEGVKQAVLGFENGQVVSRASTQTRGYREQTESSWYTSQLKGQNSDVAGQNSQSATLMLPPGHSQKKLPLPDGDEDLLNDSFDDKLFDEAPPLSDSAIEDHDALHGEQETSPTESLVAPMEDNAVPQVSGEIPEQRVADLLKQSDDDRQPSPVGLHSPSKRALTAEEHNALLLADPRMRQSSVVNPDFLKQYYRESRLHHLSTWKAELKAQLQALTQEKAATQKSRQKRPAGARRYIMHVDFDSFFAAVSLRKHPEHAGKPVVVAHGTGSGSEIASCNYPARAFGIKNGMWMKAALQLCPELKVLSYEYKAYEEASRLFYACIMATDGIVQSVSIDEALVDITAHVLPAGGSEGKGVSEGSIYREQSKADEIAQTLRAEIKQKTGCDVSVGIGSNILLAKVALRKAKPAGQYQIKPEEVLDFLGELTVQDLPGVAHSIGGKLEEIGVKYVKDIRGLTKERLINTLGPKTGEKIWDYSRGIDRTEVGDQVVRKSVSAEVNWGIRFVNQEQADEFVMSLCEELSRRLLENSVKGRQLTMRIMRRAADAPLDPPKHLGHGKCDTFNKSIALGVATNSKDVLGREAISILKGFNFSPGELRGLGVQMTKLEPLKPTPSTVSDSSQKRLQFKQPDTPPRKVKDLVDPIEDIKTPEKPKVSPSMALAGLPQAELSDKPLNVAGTQFILPSPSQIDPSVLAELPPDIRSKLAPNVRSGPAPKQLFESKPLAREISPMPAAAETGSRSQSPFTEIPSESQIDPETLAALPEDVQAELRAYYSQAALKRRPTQQLLPQSPRKTRPAITLPKKQTTPTKRKATSLLTRGRPSKSNSSSVSTLTQSAFLSARPSTSTTSVVRDGTTTPPPDNTTSNLSDISPSFLDALPPDIRAELLAQQRQERLKTKSGLAVSTSSKSRPKTSTSAAVGEQGTALSGGQRTIKLPPRPEKPSFTSKKLTKIEDLRNAIRSWVEMFKDVEHDNDVDDVGNTKDDELDEDTKADQEHILKTTEMGIGDGFHDTHQSPSPSVSGRKHSQSSHMPATMAKQDPDLDLEEAAAEEEEEEEEEEEDQGPYKEDVDALSTYLTRVVKEEHDIAKAVDLVRWLKWCIDDLVGIHHPSYHPNDISGGGSNQDTDLPKQNKTEHEMQSLLLLKDRWNNIVKRLEHDVQTAARGARGVRGVLDFG